MSLTTTRDAEPSKARPHHTDVSRYTADTGLRIGAAGLAFGSELIHLWVLPDEFTLSALRGLFFLVVAMAQGAVAVNLLLGPGRWTLRLGLALNVAVVTLWTFTRVIGLPMWIDFRPLPFGVPDLLATALELALIACLTLLRRRARGRMSTS